MIEEHLYLFNTTEEAQAQEKSDTYIFSIDPGVGYIVNQNKVMYNTKEFPIFQVPIESLSDSYKRDQLILFEQLSPQGQLFSSDGEFYSPSFNITEYTTCTSIVQDNTFREYTVTKPFAIQLFHIIYENNIPIRKELEDLLIINISDTISFKRQRIMAEVDDTFIINNFLHIHCGNGADDHLEPYIYGYTAYIAS